MLISLGREGGQGETFKTSYNWPLLHSLTRKKCALMGQGTDKISPGDTCIESVFTALSAHLCKSAQVCKGKFAGDYASFLHRFPSQQARCTPAPRAVTSTVSQPHPLLVPFWSVSRFSVMEGRLSHTGVDAGCWLFLFSFSEKTDLELRKFLYLQQSLP